MPVQVVYDAWTRPEHMRHWFGPKGFTVVACEIDAGGVLSEFVQLARPHLEVLRAHVEAKPKPETKKSDA